MKVSSQDLYSTGFPRRHVSALGRPFSPSIRPHLRSASHSVTEFKMGTLLCRDSPLSSNLDHQPLSVFLYSCTIFISFLCCSLCVHFPPFFATSLASPQSLSWAGFIWCWPYFPVAAVSRPARRSHPERLPACVPLRLAARPPPLCHWMPSHVAPLLASPLTHPRAPLSSLFVDSYSISQSSLGHTRTHTTTRYFTPSLYSIPLRRPPRHSKGRLVDVGKERGERVEAVRRPGGGGNRRGRRVREA